MESLGERFLPILGKTKQSESKVLLIISAYFDLKCTKIVLGPASAQTGWGAQCVKPYKLTHSFTPPSILAGFMGSLRGRREKKVTEEVGKRMEKRKEREEEEGKWSEEGRKKGTCQITHVG